MNLLSLTKSIAMSVAIFIRATRHFYLRDSVVILHLFIENKFLHGSRQDLVTLFPISLDFPIYLRHNSSDVLVLNQVILKEEYRSVLTSSRVKKILDIGANIGLTSLYLSKYLRNAEILAVEPDSSNYGLLKLNTQHLPQVRTLRASIWDKSTTLSILTQKGREWGSQVSDRSGQSQHITPAIDITSLLKQIKWRSVDLVKIDVEGAEARIFEGDTSWLMKVKKLYIEIHERYSPGSTELIISKTKAYGFKVSYEKEHFIFTTD